MCSFFRIFKFLKYLRIYFSRIDILSKSEYFFEIFYTSVINRWTYNILVNTALWLVLTLIWYLLAFSAVCQVLRIYTFLNYIVSALISFPMDLGKWLFCTLKRTQCTACPSSIPFGRDGQSFSWCFLRGVVVDQDRVGGERGRGRRAAGGQLRHKDSHRVLGLRDNRWQHRHGVHARGGCWQEW